MRVYGVLLQGDIAWQCEIIAGRRVSTMWQGYNRHTMHYKEERVVAARRDQCNDRFMPVNAPRDVRDPVSNED